ncbi:hypothetical protein ABB27_06420 [Stenotrophomonas terrae]|uniref:Uncharacterized protein n=1 Tax=Stenotrophomonas terrae TaxID=405446 RepID=A0A0R0CT47_9GAMM|nr:DUF4124 domain-containing protein [Stenotrophomonas terrae]KRG69482.1 hypothetical protein ABB27_06420 [Stenotrophomonas terrae]
MRLLLLLLLTCSALAVFNARAQQVNRCTNSQGQTVYGDKPCEVMGARARLLPNARTAGGSGLYRDSCARRLSELVAQIQSAADARDPNRLSGIYLWNGLSNAAATRVMDRLDEIVQRPLVDIAPVFPEEPAYVPAPTEPFTYTDGTPVDATQDGGNNADPQVHVITNVRTGPRRPIALRLEQTLPRSATPTRTILHLRRQYNCFWITL